MKTNIIYIFLFMLLLSSCSGGKKLISSWHDDTTFASHNKARTAYQYDEDTQLFYQIGNDKEFLYLSLKADQPILKKKILFGGLNIWVDSTAKGKEDQGIQLLSSVPNHRDRSSSMNTPPTRGEGPDINPMGKDYMKNIHMECIGLPYADIDYDIYNDSLMGLNIDLIIPLESIITNQASPNPIISLIIEGNTPPMDAKRSGGRMSTQGMGGRSGGGMQGGGMSGGRGGGQKPPQDASQQKELKITIKKLQLAGYEKNL